MTAPAAPTLYGRFDGDVVRLRWRPVALATDYKLYVGGATAPTTLEADIPDDDLESDGWFVYQLLAEEVPTFIRLTSLNVGAEESAYSNELNVPLFGSFNSFPPQAPGRVSSPF